MSAESLTEPLGLRISGLRDERTLAGFRCGVVEIDKWARNSAYKRCRQHRSRVFVACLEGNDKAVGFFSLSTATEENKKILPEKDELPWGKRAPIIYIEYLAVSRDMQNGGIGKMLLVSALNHAFHVFQHVPFLGVGLRSLNDRTGVLYQRLGFRAAPNETENPLMLMSIRSVLELYDKNNMNLWK